MYKVIQKQKKQISILGFKRTKTIKNVYRFEKYGEALQFALNEQISTFFYEVGEGITTSRKPFNKYMKEKEFLAAARKNPFYYLGVHEITRVNCIKSLYYKLIQDNKLNKLIKH